MKLTTLVANASSLRKSVLTRALVVVLIAVAIGLLLLNPIWSSLSTPFPILRVSPPITAPVDGPYYLQNAEQGYQWDTKAPLSLSYHPFMSLLVYILPNWVSGKLWFWLLSILFAIGSLVLVHHIAMLYSDGLNQIPHFALVLVLLVPGGLSVATGNPEIPSLFFSSLLLLSVVKWHDWRITVIASIVSILIKPNALYMVPMLIVYAIAGFKDRSRPLLNNSIIGILSLLLGWFVWIAVVDWQTSSWGAYWNARVSFSEFVAGDPASYFLELVRSLYNELDLRNLIRYSTGIIIPIVNLVIISATPFTSETHRYALASANLAMLFLVLWQGNPNKVIVYSTTIPGYFAVFLVYMKHAFSDHVWENPLRWTIVQWLFVVYIALMLIVYVLGTPLGWYF